MKAKLNASSTEFWIQKSIEETGVSPVDEHGRKLKQSRKFTAMKAVTGDEEDVADGRDNSPELEELKMRRVVSFEDANHSYTAEEYPLLSAYTRRCRQSSKSSLRKELSYEVKSSEIKKAFWNKGK